MARAPDTRKGDRHKSQITLHLDQDLTARLQAYVESSGQARHGVIVAALDAFLPPKKENSSTEGENSSAG